MSTYANYLLKIINDPKTSTEEYLRAEVEFQLLQAHQNYLNQVALPTELQRQTYKG